MKVGIINYGMGNIHSVMNALTKLHIPHFVSDSKAQLDQASHLILPGVGAFRDAILRLEELDLIAYIENRVAKKTPLLGICLGMQLLFEKSYEFGEYNGLALLDGEIVALDVPLKIPHMGWNDLIIEKDIPIFKGIDPDSQVYYVHSYYLQASSALVAWTDYGRRLPVAAAKDHVIGLQFHPEKSGETGLKLLQNFVSYY